MKKLITIIICLALILAISACSKNKNEQVQNTTSEEELEDMNENLIGEEQIVNEEPPSEETEPQPEEEQETTTSAKEYNIKELIVERRIGEYEFEESSIKKNKLFGSKNFDYYIGEYSFGNTKTTVSILIPSDAKAINTFNSLVKVTDEEKYELLDDEDNDYLEYDVYFNPYENKYIWMSKEKLILIEYPIGTDLLERYLEKYPTTVIKGNYENEEVGIELTTNEDEKIIFLNNNQYIISLVNLDTTNNEATLKVNNEEKTMKENERGPAGDLLIEITNIQSDKLQLNIETELAEKDKWIMNIGETKEFKMLGKTNTLEFTGANSEGNSVIVKINGELKTIKEGQAKATDDLEVKLESLFISNIGLQQTTATFSAWPRS
ncbi:MAG: hypothetical protein ABIC91_02440 [Nanoarchaeota archaeon]|nr:hypothetical protein [Nanoarchaeota archaeon]MBU1030105.1 hypothetical protein [Nanoarchaeota archaeon]MBU1849988.1 hypothetical protein [Nanoarchaeota archaeon]